MQIQKRNITVSFLLTLCTCGIYGIYWFVVLTDELKQATGDSQGVSGIVAFLLTLVTCGIYGFYWAYKMGERVDNAKTMRGMYVEENSGVLFLILQFFGLPIVNYILIQSTLNDIISFDQYNSGATAFTTF